MARGYMGKMLRVDLSRHELKDEALDEKMCRDYIGGYGIAAKIIFSEKAAGSRKPLSPASIDRVIESVSRLDKLSDATKIIRMVG